MKLIGSVFFFFFIAIGTVSTQTSERELFLIDWKESVQEFLDWLEKNMFTTDYDRFYAMSAAVLYNSTQRAASYFDMLDPSDQTNYFYFFSRFEQMIKTLNVYSGKKDVGAWREADSIAFFIFVKNHTDAMFSICLDIISNFHVHRKSEENHIPPD
jgi:hypothetical protein